MEITVTERPEDASYGQIHALLSEAHKENMENGFHVRIAQRSAEELENHVGKNGKCFVVPDEEKLAGVTGIKDR